MKEYKAPEFDLTIFNSIDVITISSITLDDGLQEDIDDVLVIE